MALINNSNLKAKRIIYALIFLLLFAFKIGAAAISITKQQEKAVTTQADGENEKSSERGANFEKEIAYQMGFSNVLLLQATLVAHFTHYNKSYIPSHYQAVKLQPPKSLSVC